MTTHHPSPTHPSDVRPTAPVASAEHRLRLALRVDAVASGASGALLALAPDQIADVLGTGHPGGVRAVGVFFLVFAAGVALTSTLAAGPMARWARVVAVGNAAWAVGTTATIALGWYEAAAGVALVLAQAAMVAGFAVAQRRAARGVLGVPGK